MVTEYYHGHFYCYFPEGMYRTIKLQPDRKKILSAVDKLLNEHPFDKNRYIEENKLAHQKFKRAAQFLKGGQIKDADKIGYEAEEHVKTREKMIDPFFKMLLDLGYSEEQLSS